jgi:3-deoxy-D-manno-octulosonic acid hydroxylase-like protein
MALVKITDYSFPTGFSDPSRAAEAASKHCQELEDGEILAFDKPPFDFPEADREFLLAQKQSGLKVHKNVSYRPRQDLLRGDACETPEDNQRLHEVMRRYSAQVTQFVDRFLQPYAAHRILDFASYRPLEEKGRDLSTHKRNDLMHVDAFPSRPTFGARILRVFTNINPSRPRVWETTDKFDLIVRKFADDAGLPKFAAESGSAGEKLRRTFAPVMRAVGIKGMERSAYDRFMLRFHDYLKESNEYQNQWKRIRLEFNPGMTWMVYTDQVPHAALSGQFMTEQTFIIPLKAMVTPERCPLRVLEAHCGKALVN